MMVSRMTTELFHAQLEENIVRAADERKRHQEELRNCRKLRNEAGFRRDKAKVEETNLWTLNNNTIQSDRHKIFERYREAGGYFREQKQNSCTQAGPKTRKEE